MHLFASFDAPEALLPSHITSAPKARYETGRGMGLPDGGLSVGDGYSEQQRRPSSSGSAATASTTLVSSPVTEFMYVGANN